MSEIYYKSAKADPGAVVMINQTSEEGEFWRREEIFVKHRVVLHMEFRYVLL